MLNSMQAPRLAARAPARGGLAPCRPAPSARHSLGLTPTRAQATSTVGERPPSASPMARQPSGASVSSQGSAEPGPGARPPVESSAEVVVMVLGGGPGNDLRPLTDVRAEPAMPVAGLFRLIDIPVSNCINSGLTQIYVLTQFNSTSLNRHLSRAYSFLNGNLFTSGRDSFVESLNASQRPGHVTADAWYQGTADAVRRYAEYLTSEKHAAAEDVLILAGDQLYRMDYAALINYHRARGADVTIASTPADEDHALHLGILKVDEDLNVQCFAEKPEEETLHTMSMDTQCHYGLCATDAEERPYVASMGIYVFKKQVLLDLLTKQFPAAVDFSRDILPAVVGQNSIIAYPHTTYWEDVGSLRAYYAAHMSLAQGTLKLRLFDKQFPIYTEPRTLPPTKMTDTTLEDCLLGDGCRVIGSTLRSCVVGSCTYIDRGCDLQEVIVFGADEFELDGERAAELAGGVVPLGIGAGSVVKGAILDKNVRIGRNVRLVNEKGVRDAGPDAGLPAGVTIRDGILVVRRSAVVPDGTVV
ncbi:glucose-1-phosphate adenylyltransferase [Raphidocelis subcapitata]|uniref:glucose-1-phosphate adenylyltransferase n=1 Tax=Raphidocelis subcapitata TaxID=307507 RepID=A0A2V0PHI0_9CHLO|nr:glucose-1-phosphate adenylyltransferase [Raphidocelis subcapitata]|eukprot:GBF96687.1 glucose-1-phosphate adenylyltransferase [Raphidocelis subcapitata]